MLGQLLELWGICATHNFPKRFIDSVFCTEESNIIHYRPTHYYKKGSDCLWNLMKDLLASLLSATPGSSEGVLELDPTKGSLLLHDKKILANLTATEFCANEGLKTISPYVGC